jgi:hypothetical protein
MLSSASRALEQSLEFEHSRQAEDRPALPSRGLSNTHSRRFLRQRDCVN